MHLLIRFLNEDDYIKAAHNSGRKKSPLFGCIGLSFGQCEDIMSLFFIVSEVDLKKLEKQGIRYEAIKLEFIPNLAGINKIFEAAKQKGWV